MENDDVSVAEASSQPPAKRVKLSSPAPNNIKPVFGRLDVALNTDDSGDITVNISNTRRLGKPVVDHVSDETFAFYGSRQQAHAMLDRILDHSENTIIMGMVPATIQTLDLTGATAAASENPTATKPYTPTTAKSATSTATEKETSAREEPATPSVTHQSQQPPQVAVKPKPLAPQNSSLVLSRGHLEIAWYGWQTSGQRSMKLPTLLGKLPENNHPNPSVECMVVRNLAGKKPVMMIGGFEGIVHSFMFEHFRHNLQRNVPQIREDLLHFLILKRLWFYPDDGKDGDFPWATMEPKSSEGRPSLAYATFKKYNGVGANSRFSILNRHREKLELTWQHDPVSQ
ncbi:hypothetical protein CFIO01_10928 [Colletotrichum fioriniae PJ7]|uniref:Uncharacterized protein n=1 Tax=Colletotrichum fioriniae PJ7 TaxID=1445577 RepID=A0A010RAD0_9PEZI|nr:hypothetical protein CFIO01_10928 [Colletotrichum fioriniae PJ7]